MDTITYFDEFNLLEDSFTKMANIIDEKDVKLKNLAFFDSYQVKVVNSKNEKVIDDNFLFFQQKNELNRTFCCYK